MFPGDLKAAEKETGRGWGLHVGGDSSGALVFLVMNV